MSDNLLNRKVKEIHAKLHTSPQYRRDFLNGVNHFFNLEEVRHLCFYLIVDYDSLEGTGKKAKIRELILFMERKNKLPDLIDLVISEMPNYPQ